MRTASVRQSWFRVLVVTRGTGTLLAGNRRCELRQYDRILIPAATEEVGFRTDRELEVVAALPPEEAKWQK